MFFRKSKKLTNTLANSLYLFMVKGLGTRYVVHKGRMDFEITPPPDFYQDKYLVGFLTNYIEQHAIQEKITLPKTIDKITEDVLTTIFEKNSKELKGLMNTNEAKTGESATLFEQGVEDANGVVSAEFGMLSSIHPKYKLAEAKLPSIRDVDAVFRNLPSDDDAFVRAMWDVTLVEYLSRCYGESR